MAFSTPPSPPSTALRRPFFIRWWYDPKQRRRVIIGTVLALLYSTGLAYGSWTRVCAAERCPSIMRLNPERGGPQQTSKVYAADGRLITELGIERRTVLPLSEIPVHVRQAFIAVEDKRFYEHNGIDYWRILGAVKANVLTLRYAQGFSTITMQLARNVFPEHLGREKRLTRKLREARVAVELERNFPKDTILELYLNQISLGPNVAGVEAAGVFREVRP
jgi:penicillin-binding protein 1A